MRDSTHINKYRRTDCYPSSFGMNGAFSIPLNGGSIANCISFDGKADAEEIRAVPGCNWEHVSIHIMEKFGNQTIQKIPNWNQMCRVKELFWHDHETVVQFHPSKSDYVNIHAHVLHLWRPLGFELVLPPKICV